MTFPSNYAERVYAGVLGKIIGVYLGRPVEAWTYERIKRRFGQIDYYVHDQLQLPLIVTDDDISGTFTFLRALRDFCGSTMLSAQQVGQTWLNYIIEERTILWWGGMGNSTEHTAFLRLKNGIQPPLSGSIALNGPIIAQQIGAQIFIDGWGMVFPGEPDRAAEYAQRAASVSHDGESIYAAQLLAAMLALAFVCRDLNEILDAGLKFIPQESLIYKLVADIREWHCTEDDWQVTRIRIEDKYGYQKYPGVCHVIPNHALIHLGLLYGGDDFQRSLMIVNTSGWDTDCNSGNIGCFLGIKNGLKALDGKVDWRGPVADRMYLSSADGGRAITDAAQEALHVVNTSRELHNLGMIHPKDGARYHFEFSGSLQGFRVDPTEQHVQATLKNVQGNSSKGQRSLMLAIPQGRETETVRFGTNTFIPPEAIDMPGYEFIASPSLYPGQPIHAGLASDPRNLYPVNCRLYIKHYGEKDRVVISRGPAVDLQPGEEKEMTWRVEDLGGDPIFEVGIEVQSKESASSQIYLDFLTWNGNPTVILKNPKHGGLMWRRAWVNGVSIWEPYWPEAYRLIQNNGVGLLIQGSRDWSNYWVEAAITPHLVSAAGIAAHVQGLKRYYALLLTRDGKLRLAKEFYGRSILSEIDFSYEEEKTYILKMAIKGNQIRCWLDGELRIEYRDTGQPLENGGIALICEEGCLTCDQVVVASE